jgi:hypothetical protein
MKSYTLITYTTQDGLSYRQSNVESAQAKPSVLNLRPRQPLGQVNPRGALESSIVVVDPVDLWYHDFVKTVSPPLDDRKGRLLESLGKTHAMTLRLQKVCVCSILYFVLISSFGVQLHPGSFAECRALSRSLKAITKAVQIGYTNESWLDRPPPISINQ